ncbi:unnamed protein product [Prorocentrum cordatum]|uniref:Reverse transcriptase Ty1/copia-type domain-containing protein n=1 Tax=Prorocentrum cordatum TaxID=2364126 RepID=A0ABN9VD22_9DINO|nr:unnamed protein product [Polarella glacialis]
MLTYHEHEDVYETSYIFAITARSNQVNYVGYNVGPWLPMSTLVDNCADEHACSPEDFYWGGIQRSADPNLEAANGHKIRHFGERSVKLKLNAGKNLIITFQVCDVKGPILSVGKFCGYDSNSNANVNMNGGTLYHEAAGEVNVDRVKNHYALQCWVEKPDGDLQPTGAHAPPAGVDYVEQEVVPAQTLPGPKEPSKEEIETHNLLHDPPMPWCEICIKAKGRDACHRAAAQKPIPVIQLDYAEAGSGDSDVPNFEFMVGVDMSTGAAKEDVYVVLFIVSWLAELGRTEVIMQSDGAPAAEAVMRAVEAKVSTMESPPCEVILQQSQRCSHQSNGGAERMVPTIRNQMKAYKIHIETDTGMTILRDSPLLAWFPRHAAWQYTRFHKRQDSGMTAYEMIRRVESTRRGRAMLEDMQRDPWNATPVARGRPPKVRSDQEPILIGGAPMDVVGAALEPHERAKRARVAAGQAAIDGEGKTDHFQPEVVGFRGAPTSLQRYQAATFPGQAAAAAAIPPTSPQPQSAAERDAWARARLGRPQAAPVRRGDAGDEEAPPTQRRRVAVLRETCEGDREPNTFVEARMKHIDKLTKVPGKIIKEVKRSEATTAPLSGRWVESQHDDGALKARWTTRGYAQTLNGNENFFSATPATVHLKMMLVDAAKKGHVAAIGDCSGAFYQALLDPDGNREKVYIEPPPEAGLGPDAVWEAVSAFPGLKGSPKAWETHSSGVLTDEMHLKQSHYDGCVFYSAEGEFDQKAGRHIDDFFVTGPKSQVEAFLGEAKEKLNTQGAVRLYETGDEGRLLAMDLREIEGGFALQGNPLLITDMAELLGLENAKYSAVPETANAKKQSDDDDDLDYSGAEVCKSRVGKAMHASHHRADIQHAVNALLKRMKQPTNGAPRKLEKLARYPLGTRDVCPELVPNQDAETLETFTDSDWADDKDTRKSVSCGAIQMHGCSALTYARTQKTPALSSAEAELYAIGSGAIETLGAAQLLKEWKCDGVNPLLMTYSQSALAVCRKRGPGKMKHVELKTLAIQDWVKEGRLRIHKVSTHENPADLMTKELSVEKMTKFSRALGLRGGPFGY